MALTTRFLMSALIILGIVAHSEASKPGVDGRLAAVLLRDEDNYNHGFPGAVCTFTFVKGCACNGDTSVCKCTDSDRNDVCTTNNKGVCKVYAPDSTFDGFAVNCVFTNPDDTRRISETNTEYDHGSYEGPCGTFLTFDVWKWVNGGGRTTAHVILPCTTPSPSCTPDP